MPFDFDAPATVLNVNDDAATRYAFTRRLEQAGFAVAEASTAAEALARAADLPELVVLDVKLPDGNGFDVCRRIKADPRTRHVAVLLTSSAFVSTPDRVHGLDGGADGYLVQPAEAVELVATVRALVRTKRAERALRESEERFRRVQEASPHGLMIFDPVRDAAGRVVDFAWAYANPAAERTMGRPRAGLVGRTMREFVPAEASRGHFDRYVRAFETGALEQAEVLYEAGGAGGAGGAFRASAFRLGDQLAIVYEDVTERRRAEAERAESLARERAAREVAEGANRAKDEFLATVSHELRTPLNAVLGWARLLRAGALPEGRRARALEAIERNAVAQAQVVDDLLDVSRIVAGKLRIEVRPVDLASVVEAALDSVRPALEAKQIRFERRLDGAARRLHGDPQRLQQVVWNLLSNAARFTPPGGRIELTLGREGGEAVLAVSDTGEGIAPDVLPHVFERFWQADGSSTRAHGGLGLGLAIVRHIVELHGGTVEAHSGGRGAGARLSVRLPLGAAPRPEAAPPPAAREAAPAAGPARLEGVRVLVVDDEPDARDLAAAILEPCGCRVATASNVDEALRAIAAEPPDVLLSDVGLPGEDGYALIRRVRALPRPLGAVPAAAVTAFARAVDRGAALRAGYQMHVPKPLDPAELVAVVAALARRGAP